MKTEHHTMTHSPKVTRGVNSAKVTDPANPSVKKDADGPGGFLTLLTQMETDQTAQAPLGIEYPLSVPMTDAELAAKVAGESGLASGFGYTTDHSALLAQLGQAAGMPLDGASIGGADKESGDATARTGRIANGRQRPSDSLEAGWGAKSLDAGDLRRSLSLATGIGKSEGSTDTKSLPAKAVGLVKPDNLHSQALSAAQEARHDKLLHTAQIVGFAELPAEVNRFGAIDGTLRQAERALAKFSSARTSDNGDGGWRAPDLFSGSPQGIEPANSAEAMVAPEFTVAEQVKYWITQDVQNAELKIDGFDGLPVDVSITLKGNEASVDFRTDQEGIREVLQNTESHLKDVLAREGLVLSGVSIGSSMQQGSRESSQGRSSESKRRIEVSLSEAPPVGQARPSSAVAGKSIDVFV